ncbi:trans-sialidase, putative, partial [Trypanosoma cruzi]
MLSRVAAVKAPRTHNRRRVTGSSGRRREGRESEPQRPHMSRRVFTSAVLFLLVVMMTCCGSGAAAADGSKTRNAIDPFTVTTPVSFANWKEFNEDGSKITSLRVPGLVKVGDDVFAIAEVRCKDEGKCSEVGFTGIASKYLVLNGDSGPTEFSTADASVFGADLVKEVS